MKNKSSAITDLGQGREDTKIPDSSSERILSRSEERRNVVRFISPMGQVAPRWTGAHPLLVLFSFRMMGDTLN